MIVLTVFLRGCCLGLAAILLACGTARAVGGFTQTPNASTFRSGHSAVTLTSGLVLVVGGDTSGYRSAELYDPVANTWRPAGAPPAAMQGNTATLLPSGKVLLAGGGEYSDSGASSARAALYDPAINDWVPAADLQTARHHHTATLLPDGRVLVAGGYQTGFYAVVTRDEIYDPTTNVWTTATPAHAQRAWHTATLLPSGKVLMTGGVAGLQVPALTEIYDPATGTWSIAGKPGVDRAAHTAVLLPSGLVFVAGGFVVEPNGRTTDHSEVYDPERDAWTVSARLGMARAGHSAALLATGNVLLFGGASSGGSNGVAEVYSPGTNLSLPTGMSRSSHEPSIAAPLHSGKVLIYGGTMFRAGELFDPLATTHVVTLSSGANGSIHLDPVQDVVEGTSLRLDISVDDRYHIVAGGSCGGSLAGTTFTSAPILADCTIDLTFPFTPVAVVPSAGPHGTISPDTTQVFTGFSTIEFVMTPETGYQATSQSDCGWGLDQVYVGPVLHVPIWTPMRDCTIVATFDPIRVSVTTHAGAGGSIEPGDVVVNYGSVIRFSVTPDPGFIISDLTSNCAGTLDGALYTYSAVHFTTAPITTGCTISASFDRGHVVTPIIGPNGLVQPDTPIMVKEGSAAQFYIGHKPGYYINVGGGTCGGALSGSYYTTNPIVADCTVIVAFELNPLWRSAGNLITRRAEHTATLLPSGKVLIAGGNPGGAAAELYEPVTNSWAATGSLATARSLHTATLLPSGEVLAVGGGNGAEGSSASTELYDPAAGAWRTVGSLGRGRGAHTATLLASGKVLVTGGAYGGYSQDSAEIFDPSTNAWSTAQHMGSKRAYHSAALLPNGEVLVAGAGYGLPTATTEIYNPQTDLWRVGPSMSGARESYSLETLGSGRILAASGFPVPKSICNASAQAFDASAGAWIDAGTLAIARFNHTTTILQSGHALVVGGMDCGGKFPVDAEMYFPLSNAWGKVGRLTDARYGHTATRLNDGRVLVAGGYGAPSSPGNSEIFDPAIPVARCHLDIDGNGRQEALADGLLIMRHLFGLRGTALTSGIDMSGSARGDAASIEAFLASSHYDIDNDGKADALTDGLLILRYLAGLTGTQLSDGALGIGATLTRPADIIGRLNTGCTEY